MLDRLDYSAECPADIAQRWVWSQRWLDLIFLHWQVPLTQVRCQVPAPLEIATWDGSAWVSLVLFRLHVRPRWLPFVPCLSSLLEMNLRTYVRHRDQPGIWFLSVHADNRWALWLANWLTPMGYARAEMSYRRLGDRLQFKARRSASSRFALSVTCLPGPGGSETIPGTLDAWLLERYRLFAQDRRHGLWQAEVHHPRWVVQDVAVTLAANSIGEPVGLPLARAPDRAHFVANLQARFGAFHSLEDDVPGRIMS